MSINNVYVDTRGSLCPIPVIETKKALEAHPHKEIITIVDNEVSRDNVVKFGKSKGYEVMVETQGADFYIHMEPQGETMTRTMEKPTDILSLGLMDPKLDGKQGKVLLLTKDYLGEGSEELGRNLMKTFLYAISESTVRPKKIYCINSAVKLVTEGSDHLEVLAAIQNSGTEICSCGICLDYYGIKESVMVGSVTNMYAIVESLVSESVVTL